MRRGALKFDAGSGFSIYDFGAKYMRREAGIPLYAASRRLINETLNETLLAHAGDRLTFRDKTKVAGLLWDKQAKGGRCGSKAGTVRGVLLSTGEEVFGDVVIMSDGRRSQLPRWLKEGGVELPQMLKVDCKMNYATRWMRLPEDFDPEKVSHLALAERFQHDNSVII